MVASSSSSALRPKLFVARPTSIGPQGFARTIETTFRWIAGPACLPGTLCRLSSIVLTCLFRRQYRHSEYGRFLIQTERTRDLVADRRQIAQILDDGADIGLRQPGICAPWHRQADSQTDGEISARNGCSRESRRRTRSR